MNLTIQRTYCNCHPETRGCDPYELMLDGKKIANVYDPSGLTSVIKDISALKQELDDYRAYQAEIARLRRALAPLLSHADAHDYAPPIRFSGADCRDIKKQINAD